MSLDKKELAIYKQIYAVVRQIPAGKVATYGQVAAIVGRGCTARQVGYAMAGLKTDDVSTPWHRVINAKGKISPRGSMGQVIQRDLLMHEGVSFNEKEAVDFTKVGWLGPDTDWLEAHKFNFVLPPWEPKEGHQLSLFD